MKQYIGKYYGLNKIKSIMFLDEKTYKGNNILELTFEDGSQQNIPEEVIKYAITEKSTDLSLLRDILVKPIISEMVGILLEKQLKIEDFEYLFIKLRGSIQESIQKAMDLLWGKSATTLNLKDIDKILKKNGK